METHQTIDIDQIQTSETSPWHRSEVNQNYEHHVIVSTGSGTGTALEIWQKTVQPLLSRLGYTENESYQLHLTTSEGSVTEITRNVLFPKVEEGVWLSVILLSGDGGIVDIVNSLLASGMAANSRPTISLLPLGTGNALANSSGISDVDQGIRAMLQGKPKALPLFRAKFSPRVKLLVDEGRREEPLHSVEDDNPVAHGAVVCSWGHHAALVADSDTTEYRKFGDERFKMAAQEALFPADDSAPHAYRGRVSIRHPGRKQWEKIPRTEHGYVLATFASQLQAGFTISPASRPLDGKLRLVHFGALSGQEAMEVMTKAFQGGKHVDDPSVSYQEIEGFRIEFDEDDARWRRVCIDGKIIRVEKGGWVEVDTGVDSVVDLMCMDS